MILRYDEWFENMHNFHEYLAARGQLSQAREPDDPLHNPYTWTHKQDGTPVWSIMAQDPEKIQTFQAGLSGIDIAVPVVGHFDFNLLENTTAEDEEERVELIDVGGGHGACLKQILSQYPKLNPKRCILQERPDVIEMAKASGGLPEGLQLIEHDFFTDQPVKGELRVCSFVPFSPRSGDNVTELSCTSHRSKGVFHAYDNARLLGPRLHRDPQSSCSFHDFRLPRFGLRHGTPQQSWRGRLPRRRHGPGCDDHGRERED